jgi:putative membrane-bound dehydrogenase-like protein
MSSSAFMPLALLAAGLLEAQGHPPGEAAGRMSTAPGFEVELFACEPLVRQPVAIEFDDRGRLWVIQYLQYPNPAGLERASVDRYSRTVYDRVPEPPPRGPRGADRITILIDEDGDGRADAARDFVSGLNLASGIAFGHGGVYVLQAPYLLFYADRDRDDLPDGDPEVLLAGFGMEDASAVANSLTWGPDGWLYGAQGSTVTARIDGLSFQQGVWRYQPLEKRFELFYEGGGNTWGIDFDGRGNLLASTNVGGYVLLHGVQGGYYWKQFSKHGPLANPHAYGFFEHVTHHGFRGGHVTVGGIVYDGDSFPASFRGRFIAANLLSHAVYWHELSPHGSTFEARHGGELLQANDTWFAPTDLIVGPDGALYVADWHDRRTAHPDPDAEWDRTNGRIYRIAARGAGPRPAMDLARCSSADLLGLLSSPSGWHVRKARRLLAERREAEILAELERMARQRGDEAAALQALWVLIAAGQLDEPLAGELLDHPSDAVRAWTVRRLGDRAHLSPSLHARLLRLAGSDPSPAVRSQLAASARRLEAAQGLPLVRRLAEREEDRRDPHLPLLIWWAVEDKVPSGLDLVLELFATPAAWEHALLREEVLGRLMRRVAAEGSDRGFAACARLLASASAPEHRALCLRAADQGLAGRTLDVVPPALEEVLDTLWRDDTSDVAVIRTAVRLGSEPARRRALALALDRGAAESSRMALLEVLGETRREELAPPLLGLLDGGEAEGVRRAALEALGRAAGERIAAALIERYEAMGERLRPQARRLLVSRKSWAGLFLQAVAEQGIPAADVSGEDLKQLAAHGDEAFDRAMRSHWGSFRAASPAEKLAEIRRLANDLRAGSGDPAGGRRVFAERCTACHKLGGEGQSVGPDLTGSKREDRERLLIDIVDPGAAIRREYLSHLLRTADGRLLFGLIVEETAGTLALVDARGERQSISREAIDSIEVSATSLMPEDLLKGLSPGELRDLFAFLEGGGEGE